MFTVVIAEEEHIAAIREYRMFLNPFLDASRVAFCPWYPAEDTLEHIVPDLVQTVSTKTQWRAVIVTEQGREQKNPFDLVPYTAPIEPEMDSEKDPETVLQLLETYYTQLQQAKFAAFTQASEMPLTRLAAHFCQLPLTATGNSLPTEEELAEQERIEGKRKLDLRKFLMEFRENVAESQRKKEIFERITGGKELPVAQPAEILCVSTRTFRDESFDISTAWTPHTELLYSNFVDWNLYFEKMRYLVFDILPRNHQGYRADYLRFLYVLLVLAVNGTPSDCLKPGRVYRLDCENDEQALSRLLGSYDAKLACTAQHLRQEIYRIEQQQKERLSDREASAIFCSDINVPVQPSAEFRQSSLFANSREYGLAGDCPADERGVWRNAYNQSESALHMLLKQPRRALKKATEGIRDVNKADVTHADQLNDFQKEDIREYTDKEEMRMVSMDIVNVYDTDRYRAMMEQADKAVRKKIATRMAKKTTLILGITALVLFLFGFLPFIFSSLNDTESSTYALLLTLGAIGALALIAFVCLLFLRHGLTRLVRRFNAVMHDIDAEISTLMKRFSEYLSHACNMMRGYSVLNYCDIRVEPKAMLIRILKKHVSDIEQTREEIRGVFTGVTDWDVSDGAPTPFDYDFTRPVDFQFPIPYTEGMQRQIEYLQSGSTIRVPVDFIRRITARREELYD